MTSDRAPRVGVIGTGWVGSSVAISILHRGTVELWLNDLNGDIAEGEAMDLVQGSAFYPVANVRTSTVEEMRECDVIVVTAGAGGRPGQSRLDLLGANAKVVEGIGTAIRGYHGIVIMVTNPVDLMTVLLVRSSGLPPSRVIGTGTMLDTARLRQILGRELGLAPLSIHGQVVGEHGDSEVVLWSGVRVGGRPLRSWPRWNAEREASAAQEVRGAAQEIIRRKGATNHAIGLVTATLLQCVLRGERHILTVSRVQDGALGLRGVALSLPSVVDRNGAEEVIEPEMTGPEGEALMYSADVLRKAGEGILAG